MNDKFTYTPPFGREMALRKRDPRNKGRTPRETADEMLNQMNGRLLSVH